MDGIGAVKQARSTVRGIEYEVFIKIEDVNKSDKDERRGKRIFYAERGERCNNLHVRKRDRARKDISNSLVLGHSRKIVRLSRQAWTVFEFFFHFASKGDEGIVDHVPRHTRVVLIRLEA